MCKYIENSEDVQILLHTKAGVPCVIGVCGISCAHAKIVEKRRLFFEKYCYLCAVWYLKIRGSK